MTSPPSASEFNASITAAAQLLTTLFEFQTDCRCLQSRKQPLHVDVALTALARFDIKLEVRIPRANLADMRDCCFR